MSEVTTEPPHSVQDELDTTAPKLSRYERYSRALGLGARILGAAGCMYAGSLIGVAAGNNLVPIEVTAGNFEATVTMQPAFQPRGGSTINTPVGSARYARTHRGAEVVITPKLSEDVKSKDLLGKDTDLEQTVEATTAELRPKIGETALQTAEQTALFGIAGSMAGLMMFLGTQNVLQSVRSSEKQIHIPRSVALLGIVAIGATTVTPYTLTPYTTRNENYTNNVAYTGLIAEGYKYSENFQTYSHQLKDPIRQFFAINKVVEGLGGEKHAGDPDYCIYLASDPHGGGYRTLQELYEYDKQLDCTPITAILGDFGDWSYEFEKLRDSVTQLSDLNGTVMTIKGNHDSYDFIQYISEIPGIHDLTANNELKIKGVRFIGIPDPTFTPDTGETKAATQSNYDAGKTLAGNYKDTETPTVVIAHERVALEGFIENLNNTEALKSILFIAAGHSHTQRLDASFHNSGLLYVNPGSVTGGGLRLLDKARGPEGGRLSATTIYLTKTDGKLWVSGIAQLNENFAGDDKTYSVQSLSQEENTESGLRSNTTIPR